MDNKEDKVYALPTGMNANNLITFEPVKRNKLGWWRDFIILRYKGGHISRETLMQFLKMAQKATRN